MKKTYYKIILCALLTILFINKGYSQTEKATFKQKIVASDRTAGDNYGVSMATSGNYAIVGATNISSAGSVYILEKNATTGVWTQKQKLQSSDWLAADYFGYAVAIKGDTAVVGAPNKAYIAGAGTPALVGAATTFVGAAYVFIRNSSTGVWEQKQKLFSSSPTSSAAFGFSVAVENDLIIVGASSERIEIATGNTAGATGTGIGAAVGAAYVFRGTAGVWSSEQRLVAGDRVANAKYGSSVAVRNGIVFIGASGATATVPLAGAVYVLTSSANVWTQSQKLAATTPNSAASFGYSISANGDYLLVGAFQQTVGSNAFFGSAFVFKNTAGTWAKVQEIVGTNGLFQGRFGVSVTLNDKYLLIGEQAAAVDANGANSITGAGAAHLFKKDVGVDNWTLLNRFTAPNRLTLDNFGISVALSDSTILVGAYKEDEDAGEANTLTDAGSIYSFKAEVPTVLPVSLVNYSAKLVNDGSVELSWLTSAEKNNDHFVIERSLDGKTFTAIGTVLAKGTSGSTYSFKDLTPSKGTNYYRLSQVDYNGTISYLGIKEASVSFSLSKTYTVAPNPIIGNAISLSIANPAKTAYKVTLINISGKKIFESLVPLNNTELQFTIPSVTPGTYIISVETLGAQSIIIK